MASRICLYSHREARTCNQRIVQIKGKWFRACKTTPVLLKNLNRRHINKRERISRLTYRPSASRV